MRRPQSLSLIVGGSILAVAAAVAAWPQPSPAVRAEPNRRAVRLATVEAGETTRSVRLAGVTRAAHRAELSFAVPARLATRPVEVGDAVRRGQVLATLDAREYRLAERAAAAALAELRVRLAQADRDLERVERLEASRAATAEEVEQARAAADALGAAHEAAASRLAESRRLLEEAVLTAPFDATVTAVQLQPGEWASPGAPVVALAGSGPVEVLVEAPESVRLRLHEGDQVTVELPFAGLSSPGRVTSLAAAAAGPGHLFPVVVTLDDGTAVPGLAAEVELDLERAIALTVPLEAVLNPGSSRPSVFRVMNGRADQVQVALGRMVGDRVEVDGALRPGQQVVVAGHTGLTDDDVVEVF